MSLLLAALPLALAFRLGGGVWVLEDQPIPVTVDGANAPGLPQTPDRDTGRLFAEDVSLRALCNWRWAEACEGLPPAWAPRQASTCSALAFTLLEPGVEAPETRLRFDWWDSEDILGAGSVAVTVVAYTSEPAGARAGTPLRRIAYADVLFNDQVRWMTGEEDEGCPGDAYSAEAVATTFVGYALGLDRPCALGEPCDEAATTTLGWEPEPCATSAATLTPDDLAAIEALYGPTLDIEGGPTLGAAPLEACFEAVSSEPVDALQLTWELGGEAATGSEVCHVFQDAGRHVLRLHAEGEAEGCPAWSSTVSLPEGVTACAAPEPGFELAPAGALRWQLINNTPLEVFGCVDEVRVQLFAGGRAEGEPLLEVEAWSPLLELPEQGLFTVKLSVGGPGGEASTTQTIDAGAGCATGGGGGAAWTALLLLALRRRRG